MAVKERVLFLVSSFIIIHLFMLQQHAVVAVTAASNYTAVQIGVVLDSNSSIGSMVEDCMYMAVSDFYALHSNYKTRLFLHTKHAQHQLDATSQVLELLEKEKVHGIVELTEGILIKEIGKRVRIPILSLTSRSQSDLDPKNDYFIHATPDNLYQLKALVAICKTFEWNQTTVLYEDTESGREFFSELNKAFQVFDIGILSVISVSPLASNDDIKKHLDRVMMMQNRVLLVHMSPVLGSRMFVLAQKNGMMSKDYAWIVTDSIGNFLNSMDSAVIEAMEGVIGTRAYVPISKNLKSFRERLRHQIPLTELNVYGLFAYDTVWALAMASEMIGPIKSGFSKVVENGENESYLSSLAISDFGPKLVKQLNDVSFEGLSGEFKLINGTTLKPSPIEIFNVNGTGRRTIAYWTPEGGIAEKPSPNIKEYSTSAKTLKKIVWPGDSHEKPKGWAFPGTGMLRVGVPKKTGFLEFVNVSEDIVTKEINATGFSIAIFLEALEKLPFKLDYEYKAFVNDSGSAAGTYSDLLNNISKYDIVVGDFTILAGRSAFVDYTLPYSESEIVMVVKNKQDNGLWVFLKPFRWNLWVTIIATCIFIGIVLRVLEHRAKSIPDNARTHKEHKHLLYWFPIAVLAFPEKNIVNTNWSRFVLVVWLYMSYIVMQSYTAKLSSMFTIDQLSFKLSQDINVGYQQGSFVKDFLVKRLYFNESKLIPYTSVEDIHDGMSKGSNNGGFDAIVDETPYIKLLLNRYGSKYTMFGPTYKTDGFGFACPLNSPLTPFLSRAILKVTANTNFTNDIERKYLGKEYSSDNQIDSINQDNHSLTFYDFGGLFIIYGSAMLLAIFCSSKLFVMSRQYIKNSLLFLSFCGKKDFRTNSVVYPAADASDSSSSSSSSGEEEVEMTEQINVNTCIVDHQVGSNHVSGQSDESNQSEGIEEIQQS